MCMIWPVLYKKMSLGPGVGQHGVEAELVGDIGIGVVVVVDMDLVEDVVAELVEVRPTGRLLEGHVVGDYRDRAGVIGADEGVKVGAIGDGVLGDLRRFAM